MKISSTRFRVRIRSGKDLRYAPVYDKIKEARREDDDLNQGAWQHERKVADFSAVIKLAQEAIATQSKDLQLAAWLSESLLKTKGFAGLCDGLILCHGLIERFWDTFTRRSRMAISSCGLRPSTGSARALMCRSRASAYAAMATISSSTKIRAASLPRIRPRPRSRKPTGKRL